LLDEYVGELVDKNFDDVLVDSIKEEILHSLLIEVDLKSEEFESLGNVGVKDRIIESAKTFYQKKEEMLGSDLMARLERYATLSVIDHKWKEHLREMDDLKEGIGLRAYGQKDPLVEYKAEAFKLFVILLENIRNEVVSFAFKFFPQAPDQVQTKRKAPSGRMLESKQSATNIGLATNRSEGGEQVAGKAQPIKAEEKVGRNDPCPCGSGKKYKNCHGN
jgi:preprotein translocase subunit SecA